MEVRPGIYTYELAWGWGDIEEALCVHVVETDEATVLFGTGDESTADELLEVTSDHDIDVVIAEHGDIDHYGGIPRLTEELDVTAAIPAGDTTFLDEADIEYDVTLEGGETHWGIETIAVPGHTPDNLAYLFEDVLIAGDTVAGSDSAFCMEGEWPGALAPLSEPLNDDTELMLESLSNLLEYDFEVVLTSHGNNVLEDAMDEVQLLVDAVADR